MHHCCASHHHRPITFAPWLLLCALLLLSALILGAWSASPARAEAPAADQAADLKQRIADFQKVRIVPEGGMFMFAVGDFPKLTWEQPLVVREAWGELPPMQVRWFDAQGQEVTRAEQPGRYAAFVEARVPDGPVIRRSRTFYAFDTAEIMRMFRERHNQRRQVEAPVMMMSASAPDVVHEAFKEFAQEAINQHLFRSEKGAILFAAAAELRDRSSQATPMDHPMILHQEHHLAIRRRLLGVDQKYPPLNRPLLRDEAAPVLREGTPAEAGLAEDLPAQLDALCQRWASEAREPFTLLVARRGVIVFHQAYGMRDGSDVTQDTAYPMFSITKSMTGLMAAQFIDQGLLQLDAPLGETLTDFPTEGDYVLRLRDALMHTSGIEGQIAFDGLDNPWMDNVIANGWQVHEQQYHYSGTAMDVVGFAMATISGKSVPRLYHEHLFEPMEMKDARVTCLGMGGHLRALDLAKLGQLLLNRGSYGRHEFFSPETYELLLPRPYAELYPHLEVRDRAYGLGIRYAAEKHPQAGQGDVPEDATIFSPQTLGHGSFSGSIWRIDPQSEVIVAMGRFGSGEKHGEFSQELFMTVMQAVRE